MKQIITHLSPHLDEIFAIWVFKKFDPEFKEVLVKFKPTNPQGGEVPLDEVDKDADIIYLGLGRGRFDEHDRENIGQKISAGSLVWEDLKLRGLAPTDSAQLAAIEKLVDFIIRDDSGELKGMNDWLVDFSLFALWDGFSKVVRGDSNKKLEYGLPLMDSIYAYLLGLANAEEVLKGALTFNTPWGKGIAVESDYKETQVAAYRQGYNVLVVINPKLGYHLILANPASTTDLTAVYEKLKSSDSQSEWYLHQSKRMLISGSHSAPNVKISKLTLKQMIDLVRS